MFICDATQTESLEIFCYNCSRPRIRAVLAENPEDDDNDDDADDDGNPGNPGNPGNLGNPGNPGKLGGSSPRQAPCRRSSVELLTNIS